MAIASDKTKEYLQMLEDKFDTNNFYEFIKDLLNLESVNIVNGQKLKATSDQYKNYIDTTQLYAKYEDNKRRTIGVLVIKLQDNKLPANARTLQRNYIAHLLDNYNLDASLSAIYSETDDTWRLSFVKQELDFGEGKLKAKFTPAKRYSYLFGKDEPNHTAKEQLLELLENNNKQYTIEEIEEKFSVEKVTKDFFENYKENYLKLKETLECNDEFVSESNRCDFTSEEFTKKLMGQIVFIYFLQKKGWLGVRLVPQLLSMEEYNNIYTKSDIIQKKILDKYYITFNGSKKIKKDLLEKYNDNKQEIENLSDIFINTSFDNKWGSGQKRFIRAIFDNCINRKKNFFDDYLEPFFYDGLNHKRKNQYFSLFNCKIPFLNGGLFEPLDNYQWEIARFNIDNEIFSNKEETGILDFFDRYNFTMNEEEPLEKDVAVDPEMLGKIFENLLDVKDRKSKGAFYTPREIVHYMCQDSIANFLVNKVGVKYEEIKEFIQYGEMIRDMDLKDATKDTHLLGDTVFNNIIQIDKALEHIKIADPAVGSGAFPLGILNEIVKIRDILTSYMLIYNRLGLFGKKYPEEQITNNKRSIYNMKWNTIRNSIYAVDVENSAVDITKLRLWLSIVVDQVGDPEPLPNLNCKIMQGNSLIDEYNGIKLIDKKFIEELKDRDNVKLNDGGRIKNKNKYIDVSANQIQFGDGQKKAQIDDLINLKQELYGENEPSRKKILLEKIETARNELLRLNFAGTNKEKELLEIDKSHNKPYFAWMLEFIEVFIENDGFDIVIGNPPYVNIEKIDSKSKTILSKYKTAYLKYDLYILFFELGHSILKNMGILNFITSNKYFYQNYALKMREELINNTTLLNIINFEYDVFDSATVKTAILEFSNSINEKNIVNTLEIKDKKDKDSFFGRKFKKIEQKYFNNENNEYRLILNTDNQSDEIVNKIKKAKYKIDDIFFVGYGLRACSKDGKLKKKDFISDTKISEQYKKYYEGKDLGNWTINYKGKFVNYDKEILYNSAFEELFENEKLSGLCTLSDISKLRFIYDAEHYYCNHSVVCCVKWNNLIRAEHVSVRRNITDEKIKISSKFDIDYVQGILNSKLIKYYVEKCLYDGTHFYPDHIKQLPIAEANDSDVSKVKELVKFLRITNNEEKMKELNVIVNKIYGLNNEESEIIINSINEWEA